jgi:hypothetical protein
MRDFIGFELGVASCHDEDGVRMLAPDTVNHLPVLVVGGISDGTGVDDAYIRLLAFAGTHMAALYQKTPQRTALRKIQFAAQCGKRDFHLIPFRLQNYYKNSDCARFCGKICKNICTDAIFCVPLQSRLSETLNL